MIQVKIRTTERIRMAETVAEKLRIRLNNEETDFKRLDFKRPDLKKKLKTEAYEIVVGKIA